MTNITRETNAMYQARSLEVRRRRAALLAYVNEPDELAERLERMADTLGELRDCSGRTRTLADTVAQVRGMGQQRTGRVLSAAGASSFLALAQVTDRQVSKVGEELQAMADYSRAYKLGRRRAA